MALTVTLRIDGLRETLRAFDRLPDDADTQLRDASQRIADSMAGHIRAAATAEGRQAGALARTVRARRDRVPVVVAGGTSRLGRKRKPAFKLLYGSEFGSHRLPQFKPHMGSGSYWFFTTVEDREVEMGREWSAAADRIIRAFGTG